MWHHHEGKMMRRTTMLAATLGMLLAAPAADSKEIPIPLKEVPKAGLEAARARFPGVVPAGARKEVLGDEVEGFKVLLKVKGRDVAVGVDSEGKLVSVAKAVAVKALPKPVARAAQAIVPVGRLVDAAELVEFEGDTEGEMLYLIHASAPGGTDRELKVTPGGKITWNMNWSR